MRRKQAGDLPRILCIYHGGTPAMELNEEGVLVAPADDKAFKARCEPSLLAFASLAQITWEWRTSKDSTDVNLQDWVWLILRIIRAQSEGYAGVLIIHGTDTMCYTATALSLGLSGVNPAWRPAQTIPVVMTGAQNALFVAGGDAKFNLENGVRTLLALIEMGSTEVVINFSYDVLRGCCAEKMTERQFDAMRSPAAPAVGLIDANGVQLRNDLLRNKRSFTTRRQNEPAAIFGPGAVVLKLHPGLEPTVVQDMLYTGRVRVLILESLGEGNVPADGAFSLIPVIKKATNELNTPVLLASRYPAGNITGSKYGGGKAAVDAGGIPCGRHTSTATYVKACWRLGLRKTSIADFREAMTTSYAGEV